MLCTIERSLFEQGMATYDTRSFNASICSNYHCQLHVTSNSGLLGEWGIDWRDQFRYGNGTLSCPVICFLCGKPGD